MGRCPATAPAAAVGGRGARHRHGRVPRHGAARGRVGRAGQPRRGRGQPAGRTRGRPRHRPGGAGGARGAGGAAGGPRVRVAGRMAHGLAHRRSRPRRGGAGRRGAVAVRRGRSAADGRRAGHHRSGLPLAAASGRGGRRAGRGDARGRPDPARHAGVAARGMADRRLRRRSGRRDRARHGAAGLGGAGRRGPGRPADRRVPHPAGRARHRLRAPQPPPRRPRRRAGGCAARETCWRDRRRSGPRARVGAARCRAGSRGGKCAAGRAGRGRAAGLARSHARRAGAAAPGHLRRPGRRHRGERRVGRGAGDHARRHDPALRRRGVGRAGRPAQLRSAAARGCSEDAAPREPLQLAGVPRRGGAPRGARQRGCGQHLRAAERPAPGDAAAGRRCCRPHRHLRRRGGHRRRPRRRRATEPADGHPRGPDAWAAPPSGQRAPPREGSYRRRDSNPHCRPPKDRVSCQLDYAGNRIRIRRVRGLRPSGPCAASRRARWPARCTAPPRSSPPGRPRTWSGSRRSRSCRTSASPRTCPRR